MSVAELQELEEVKALVNRGQQLGVLTFAEITGAVSELDLDETDIEELHGYLERAEIELVGTVVKAAAELAEIGLTVGARALRRAVSRLPRP